MGLILDGQRLQAVVGDEGQQGVIDPFGLGNARVAHKYQTE